MYRRSTIWRDDMGYVRLGWIFLMAGLGIVSFITVLFVGGIAIDRHYSRVNCEKFAVQTNRTTKWVAYQWWNYDCLVRTADNRWIPKDNLREFGNDAP